MPASQLVRRHGEGGGMSPATLSQITETLPDTKWCVALVPGVNISVMEPSALAVAVRSIDLAQRNHRNHRSHHDSYHEGLHGVRVVHVGGGHRDGGHAFSDGGDGYHAHVVNGGGGYVHHVGHRRVAQRVAHVGVGEHGGDHDRGRRPPSSSGQRWHRRPWGPRWPPRRLP